MADIELRALANTVAQYVDEIGHVYDRSDTDPTPDTLVMPSDGKPLCIFVDPYDIAYDVPGHGSQGMSGETRDRSTILMLLVFGAAQTKKLGTLQRLARPFVRFRVKDAIRQHNTLGHVVWRAVCTKAVAGPFKWGGVEIYAAQFTIVIDQDRDVTPGS